MKNKKLSMDELIQKADAAKKANPLDLSSDQDLSIAVMNLVSLEEHFFFSGGKTGTTGFYDLINVVREMRKDLMDKLVNRDIIQPGAEVWCISKHLLAASMRLLEVGTKAIGQNNTDEAYAMFTRAYDLYSLFWGINMGLIDLAAVQKDTTISPALRTWVDEKKTEVANDKVAGDQVAGDLRAPGKASEKTGARRAPATSASNTETSTGGKGMLSSLGAWVKKSVNCCIE